MLAACGAECEGAFELNEAVQLAPPNKRQKLMILDVMSQLAPYGERLAHNQVSPICMKVSP
jgi:hypothetical protein